AWATLSLASEAEHRQAHIELADRASSDEESVRHRALATSGPDGELAAKLEQLALNARARGAPASAAELLAHARRLTATAAYEDWARRARREIPLLLSAGDCEQAWALGQEALRRLPPGPARAAILLEAAATHPGATALCEQALAEAGGDAVATIRA